MEQVISNLRSGKYIDFDVAAAYDVISLTQSLGDDWDAFLEHAPSAVLHAEYQPRISVAELRDYVLHELEKPASAGQDATLADRVRNGFDSAAIYLQQYDIEVNGSKGKVFIYRTPTEADFDRARVAILFVLELFRQARNGEEFVANSAKPEVTITVRGMENFYDIKIQSGINSEAWVGFDFR